MHAYIQVLIAICVVIILFFIGFSVYNYEFIKSIKLSSETAARTVVPIYNGIKDISINYDEVYTTTNKDAASYRNVNNSYHEGGGIEFSYSFWLYIFAPTTGVAATPNTTALSPDKGFSDRINKQTVLFAKGTNEISTYKNVCGVDKNDIMVKCPLVKLEEDYSQLTVEFNTVPARDSDYIEGIKADSRYVCDEFTTEWKKANAHKLTLGNINRAEFANKWIMVSIIIQDIVPTDPLPYRNKAHCKIYINNFKELDVYVDGTLTPRKDNHSTIKVNNGNLYVFPKLTVGSTYTKRETDANKLMMADLTYYNYAINKEAIESLFGKGPSKYTAPAIGANTDYSKFNTVALGHSSKLTTSP